MSEQQINWTCDACGKKCGARLSHYDICPCGKCGKQIWALRPVRNGPLVASPWPGTPAMLRYKQQQSQMV